MIVYALILCAVVTFAFLLGRITSGAVRYRRGIRQNPPNFLESLRREPLNIKIDDKRHISHTETGAIDTIHNIERISNVFAAIAAFSEVDDYKGKVNDVRVYARLLIGEVWQILRRDVQGKKWGARKAFYRRALADFSWFVDDVVAQMLDYYALTKKKVELLARGTTLRQTLGADFSPTHLTVDSHGRMLIVPRYG